VKVLIALLVVLVLGTVGMVIHHEVSRGPRIKVAAVDENESMVTISKGEKVDIESHVASKGITIVEFYGVF
jgi:hypothetical protein